jgi:hypothetical protein
MQWAEKKLNYRQLRRTQFKYYTVDPNRHCSSPLYVQNANPYEYDDSDSET